ncbi:MAG: hypothetical protein KA191_01165 [Verrucomicrobia bacterium]|jgi:hypothetical protein|nr:hypothetical protein [Verrucomicrobiota bacterium]OQC67987.1 MAG: hypothetical protein BWX48_00372 [Verrucomicrobia bacterium ADurb.Bin006]MDI9379639.1 hypothetical protein [Verrucomicrobiota bacterium]NMD20281.1 hypothetical protein [Verrucomicrobiota bacterium]HOF47044.1 hypothetical protein [Verrucomicrobiota bacterium]
MKTRPHDPSRALNWVVVALFALGMAWVEAACVFYIRSLVDRIEPYQALPLPDSAALGSVELVRELATLLMLGTTGWLAGTTWRSRLAFATIAFGFWDIFYYLFLRVMAPWPQSILDWDILFLLPLPWWGPVLAPVSIALLMIAGGTLVVSRDASDRPCWPSRLALSICFIGTGLALYVFMGDSIRVAGQGIGALRSLLPVSFNWPLFLVAWILMATPVVELAVRRPAAQE